MKSSEIRVGTLVLDRSSGRLRDADGIAVELRHQSREVLVSLANNPNQIVTRKALIEDVWAGRAIADDSVAQCIADIRRALGDTDKRIVETVPRQGYRLVAQSPDADGEMPRRRRGVVLMLAAVLLVAMVTTYFTMPQDDTPDAPVVAVLPFDDFSNEPHQGFLSDAISENIITALAGFPQMAVISRRSSFQFRDSSLGVSEIAEALGADFVLEGSQQYDGSRLTITAQLIDSDTEAHIWAHEINVPLEAMLEANSQISRMIARAVGSTVIDTAGASMTAGDVSALMISNAAQSRIMRSFTRENLLINISEQEKSMRDYPESAWGFLGQAISLRIGLQYGWVEGDEAELRDKMFEFARRGVELDPNNFLAYHALGRALMFNGEVEDATRAFKQGIALNPSSTIVGNGLAVALIYLGRTDEALEVLAQLQRIDPLRHFDLSWNKAWALWQAGDCDAALDAFKASPSMPIAANKHLAAIHHCNGNEDEAKRAMSDYLSENPNWTVERVRNIEERIWKAPGALERWLLAMEASGMPLR
ncbi:winged helix-turn-helix domain-containing tetratricopeptide repeat protein [Roseovarius faecimaris]|uniref:winged helix-turn-helix domain-containing tetratricopeptide repeat protein n=1 Tax=Roseovarius faecimaris TaxID=2494550 RepID=UPI001FE375AF|nr:winged helix-turn-helix domain-containing protein [Roseovarius faecimaris]